MGQTTVAAAACSLPVLAAQTYTNPEVIAIDQDALGRQAERLVGGPLLGGGGGPPLHGPTVVLQPCGAGGGNASDAAQRWDVNATGASWITTPCVPQRVRGCSAVLPSLPSWHAQGLWHDAPAPPVSRGRRLRRFALRRGGHHVAVRGRLGRGLERAAAQAPPRGSAAGMLPRRLLVQPAVGAAPHRRHRPLVPGGRKRSEYLPTTGYLHLWVGPPTLLSTYPCIMQCLTASGATPSSAVYALPCITGNALQTWYYNATDQSLRAGSAAAAEAAAAPLCATAGGAMAADIWGRPLASGAWAFAALNAGAAGASVACDWATCLGPATGWDADQRVTVSEAAPPTLLPLQQPAAPAAPACCRCGTSGPGSGFPILQQAPAGCPLRSLRTGASPQ